MEKKVSICIPVYNGEKTIKDAINSALEQTYKNIEILVIDNMSTDGTADIVKGMDDRRIVFFQNKENLGMAGNWNECIRKSTGEYIHFLCADDIIKPECIRKKMAVIERFDDVVMVISATDLVNENGSLIVKRRRFKKNVLLDGRTYARRSLRHGNIFGEPSNVLFKKDCIEKTGLFSVDLHYTTDWELWIRIATLGKIVYLDDALTQYRLSSENATSTLKLKKIMEDDTKMIGHIKEAGFLKMTDFDEFIMKSVLTVRDVSRLLFLNIQAVKNRIGSR